MMRDDIFWGNLLGLLKKGRWNLSLEESQALLAIVQEAEKRSRPPLPIPVKEPIAQEPVKPIKKSKLKEPTNAP
jgi:hypothetical protein